MAHDANAAPFERSSRYFPDYTHTTQGGTPSVTTSGQTFIYMRQGDKLYRITPMRDGKYWFGYVWPKLQERIEASHASAIIDIPADADPVTLVINGKTISFQAPSKIAFRAGQIPVRTGEIAAAPTAPTPSAAPTTPPRVDTAPQDTRPQTPAGWGQDSAALCQLTGTCGGSGNGNTASSSSGSTPIPPVQVVWEQI